MDLTARKKNVEEQTFNNMSYKDLTRFIYDLLGSKERVSVQKEVLFQFLSSKLSEEDLSLPDNFHLNFLFGCLHILLDKPKKAIKIWCSSKNETVTELEFTNGCELLTTLPFEYHWGEESKIRLHLKTISFKLQERRVKIESSSKQNRVYSLECIVNSVLEQSSKKYKDLVNLTSDNEKDENQLNKSGKSETKETNRKLKSKVENKDEYNELITRVHFLLGQPRETYSSLMDIFANALFKHGKDSSNYYDDQKADLWFLLGCFYFVSSRDKERAIRCWTRMDLQPKRKKCLLELGFTLLITLPRKYDWCEHAQANLHLTTIIRAIEDFETQSVLDKEAAKKLKVVHQTALKVLSTNASSSYIESLELLKEYLFKDVAPIEPKSTDFVASDMYNEITKKIFQLLGNPEKFGELKSLFESTFHTKYGRGRLNQFEKCHLSVLLGCFYCATYDIDEAIMLWLKSYGNHGERTKNKYILGIFESVLRELIALPTKNKWNEISQLNLHLKTILKNFTFIQESYQNIYISNKSSLPALKDLVEKALMQSSKKYKKGYTTLMTEANQLGSFEFYDLKLRRKPRKLKMSNILGIEELKTKLPTLLSNMTKDDNLWEFITEIETAALSPTELLYTQFWLGCICFASQQKYKAINIWLRLVQHGRTLAFEDQVKLLTVWPTQYRWEKNSIESLHLNQILVVINSFQKHCFTESVKIAINALQMTFKDVYEVSSDEYKHQNVVKTLHQP